MLIKLNLIEATNLWRLAGQPEGRQQGAADMEGPVLWEIPGYGTMVREHRGPSYVYWLETYSGTHEAELAMMLLSREP